VEEGLYYLHQFRGGKMKKKKREIQARGDLGGAEKKTIISLALGIELA